MRTRMIASPLNVQLSSGNRRSTREGMLGVEWNQPRRMPENEVETSPSQIPPKNHGLYSLTHQSEDFISSSEVGPEISRFRDRAHLLACRKVKRKAAVPNRAGRAPEKRLSNCHPHALLEWLRALKRANLADLPIGGAVA
jgi:hypothetical protein